LFSPSNLMTQHNITDFDCQISLDSRHTAQANLLHYAILAQCVSRQIGHGLLLGDQERTYFPSNYITFSTNRSLFQMVLIG
jgi:hypothetical protein